MNQQNQHTPAKRRTALALKYNPDGTRIKWHYWREAAQRGVKAAWMWADETGYVRTGPETWAEFVPYLRNYFESYNSTPLQDFS
jgi:hypothetical protein